MNVFKFEYLVMSGFQYFSQRSLRSSGATLRSVASLRALRETKTGHYRIFFIS
jgi:hypothetical protein